MQNMKLNKIKSTTPKKVAAILLWIVVIFLLIKGVQSILSMGQAQQVRTMVQSNKQQIEQTYQKQVGAAAFAEGFVWEYYTFSGKPGDDYNTRIKKYLSNQVEIKPLRANVSTMEVIKARASEVIFSAGDYVDVDVVAKIRYTPLSSDAAISEKDICLRVPIFYTDGQFVVYDLPVIIPELPYIPWWQAGMDPLSLPLANCGNLK